MTNDEIPNDEGMKTDESSYFVIRKFAILSSFDIRASSFTTVHRQVLLLLVVIEAQVLAPRLG